MSQVLMV